MARDDEGSRFPLSAAAAQTINPGPGNGPQPQLPTVVQPCWRIASITPASARPGEDVDIRITPVSFSTTLSPSSTTLLVGNSRHVTATLSHPAPSAITLNLNPQSTALSVGNNAAGAPGTATIPAGARSATFSVRAHAAGAPTVIVSGPNVAPATLTVNVPTPGFTLAVPNNDADVHWGDSA